MIEERGFLKRKLNGEQSMNKKMNKWLKEELIYQRKKHER